MAEINSDNLAILCCDHYRPVDAAKRCSELEQHGVEYIFLVRLPDSKYATHVHRILQHRGVSCSLVTHHRIQYNALRHWEVVNTYFHIQCRDYVLIT